MSRVSLKPSSSASPVIEARQYRFTLAARKSAVPLVTRCNYSDTHNLRLRRCSARMKALLTKCGLGLRVTTLSRRLCSDAKRRPAKRASLLRADLCHLNSLQTT